MVLDLVSQLKPSCENLLSERGKVDMWSELALRGPINPQTGRHYHPQTLARCWRGQISNYSLLKWLKKEMHNAKTKEGTRNTSRARTDRKGVQHDCGKITELSEITKAIGQKAYCYPTSDDPSKGD